MIGGDDIDKLASLARLKLEDSMKSVMTDQVNSIIEFVKQLDKVDTSHVAPMSHTNESTNVLRDDAVCLQGSQLDPQPLGDPSIPKQSMLAEDDLFGNAPDRSGRFIRVPLIVE